jgi:hypothetical protein
MDGLAPKTLIEMLRSYDLEAIAMDTLHRVDELRPYDVPLVVPPSEQLHKVLSLRTPISVPDELKFEFESRHEQVMARANAKAENLRMLRATLWAEVYLRQKGREEHEVLRAFNRDIWGVSEPASVEIDLREAQVKAHA